MREYRSRVETCAYGPTRNISASSVAGHKPCLVAGIERRMDIVRTSRYFHIREGFEETTTVVLPGRPRRCARMTITTRHLGGDPPDVVTRSA
jgi:hypothetical protein